MVVIALLLAALLCIVLGVVLTGGPWFAGSLVLSATAGFVLWRQRQQGSAHHRRAAGSAVGSGGTDAGRTVDGMTGASPSGAELAAGAWVWVVDGEAPYHRRACPDLEGKPAEAIRYPQAVEDRFTPCPQCRPGSGEPLAAEVSPQPATEPAADPAVEAALDPPDWSAQPAGEPATVPAVERFTEPVPGADPPVHAVWVWVVDGQPKYHLETCLDISGKPAEPVPRVQADDDGFAPCATCQPDARQR